MKFIKLQVIDKTQTTKEHIEILNSISIPVSTIDSFKEDFSFPIKDASVSWPIGVEATIFNTENDSFATLIKRVNLEGNVEYITVYESVDYITAKLNEKN